MLYLLSGAAASGKNTVAPEVTARVKNLVTHHENEIPAVSRRERMANMQRWVERTMEYEQLGKDLLLRAASPLGELLASPRAIELDGIAGCVLDCHDHERSRRHAGRPVDTRWPFGMDTLCWAAFHRMHAIDPQFEQRVLREEGDEQYQWTRWTSWRRGDVRWPVELIDNSSQTVSETVRSVVAWIERTRASGTPLARDAKWWE